MDMNYRGGMWEWGGGQDGVEWGGIWDNCNSIINKYIKKKKETIIKMKREPTMWENIFTKDILDKGLMSNYIMNSYDSTPGRQKPN